MISTLSAIYYNLTAQVGIMCPNKNPTLAILRALDRTQILEGFLSDIADVSDKEYQRRIWIRAEGPECDDFTEIVCRYSNAAECILDKYKEYGLTDIQLSILKKFHDEFRKFWIDNDLPQLFIDTPAWTHIAQMAKEVLQAFGYQHADNAKHKSH